MCLHTPPPPPQADPPVLRLHVDLLHAIFKLMDKTTLSMCSMVVRRWIDVARCYLFRRLAYRVTAEDERGEHFTPPPLQDLLDFLDANPSVGEHIHALSLTMLLPTDDPYDIGGRRFRGGRLETLSAILRRTQDLRILEVHRLAITEPLSHADITSLAEGPALSHVDNLHVNLFGLPLETVHGDYIPRLFQLVGTINKLEFDSFIFPSPTLDSARKIWPTYTLKHIRELHLKGGPAVGSLSMVGLDRLEIFAIDEFTQLTFPWLNTFLATTGSQLRHLTLPAHGSCLTNLLEPVLDLSICDRLESVTLTSTVYSDLFDFMHPNHARVGVNQASYAFMNRVLATAADSVRSITFRLHHMAIHFPLYAMGLLDYPPIQADWSTLDHVMTRCVTRRGAQEVQIKIVSGADPETWVVRLHAGIALVLPRTHAAGALRFADALEFAEPRQV